VPTKVAHQATRSSHQARASTRRVSGQAGVGSHATARRPAPPSRTSRPVATTSRSATMSAPTSVLSSAASSARAGISGVIGTGQTPGVRRPRHGAASPSATVCGLALAPAWAPDGANIRWSSGPANPPGALPSIEYAARRTPGEPQPHGSLGSLEVPVAGAITISWWRHGWPGSGHAGPGSSTALGRLAPVAAGRGMAGVAAALGDSGPARGRAPVSAGVTATLDRGGWGQPVVAAGYMVILPDREGSNPTRARRTTGG